MSKLRKSILSALISVGNASGCHQLPERSFFYQGQQFPVCARCTGVTIGQLIALVMILKRKPVKSAAALTLLGFMGVDWSIQALKIKSSTNIRRLLTGICGGFGVFILYRNLIKFILIHLFQLQKST